MYFKLQALLNSLEYLHLLRVHGWLYFLLNVVSMLDFKIKRKPA